MAKRPVLNTPKDPNAKKVGRSHGKLVYSEELNRLVSPKMIQSIQNNKSKRNKNG